MKKIPNSSRRLNDQILRALNQIRKPSTAVEIKELLNRDLGWSASPVRLPEDFVSAPRQTPVLIGSNAVQRNKANMYPVFIHLRN
jgi:hypothetical protein